MGVHLTAERSSTSIAILAGLVGAVGALEASAEADSTGAEVRTAVVEASSVQIATAIEGRAEEVPELGSAAA